MAQTKSKAKAPAKRKAAVTKASTQTSTQTKKRKQSGKNGKQKLLHKGRSILPGQGGYCVTCSKDSAGNHNCCRCNHIVHNAHSPCSEFIKETAEVDADGRLEGETHVKIPVEPDTDTHLGLKTMDLSARHCKPKGRVPAVGRLPSPAAPASARWSWQRSRPRRPRGAGEGIADAPAPPPSAVACGLRPHLWRMGWSLLPEAWP